MLGGSLGLGRGNPGWVPSSGYLKTLESLILRGDAAENFFISNNLEILDIFLLTFFNGHPIISYSC